MSTREERWAGFDRATTRVLNTIVDADWRAMFRAHRAGLVPNTLSAEIRRALALRGEGEIRKKILDLPTGKSEPEVSGKTSTYL